MRSRVTKAVIPAAGLGTRLLSATKEQPKEMLPVFATASEGIALKPVVQLIFEQLYYCGFREFCFVVGRGKRAIEDHFTPDIDFVKRLRKTGRMGLANDLLSFYRKVESSTVFWLNQPEPKGFGDAVLSSKSFVSGGPLLVHAGDNHVISPENSHIQRLLKAHEKDGSDATLLLRKVDDPRKYGVAETESRSGALRVVSVVEKPAKPATKWALLPTYVFENRVFDALGSIEPGVGGEYQVTDAIQKLIDDGAKVTAVRLDPGEFWLDVGNPESYWEALEASHRKFPARG